MSDWTEERIESHVERMMNHLDRLLLAGDMTQRDYDGAVRELDAWAEAKRSARVDVKPHMWRGTLNGV